MPYLRPFQDKPKQERMERRKQQWGNDIGASEMPRCNQLPELARTDQARSRTRARTCRLCTQNRCGLPSSTSASRRLASMASALTFSRPCRTRLCRILSRSSMRLSHKSISAAAMGHVPSLPFLPKSAEIERPNSIGGHDVQALVSSSTIASPNIGKRPSWPTTHWERAVPGTECLQVALKRAFLAEHHNALRKTVVSVLLDMSNFYDQDQPAETLRQMAGLGLPKDSCSTGHATVLGRSHP